MKYEPTNTDMTVASVLWVMFASCALARLFLVKRITLKAGEKWNINTPFENIKSERKALQQLPPGKLRTTYRLIMGSAVAAWLTLVIGMATREWLSKK